MKRCPNCGNGEFEVDLQMVDGGTAVVMIGAGARSAGPRHPHRLAAAGNHQRSGQEPHKETIKCQKFAIQTSLLPRNPSI